MGMSLNTGLPHYLISRFEQTEVGFCLNGQLIELYVKHTVVAFNRD